MALVDGEESPLLATGDHEMENRDEIERSLLWKLDRRMSILVLIYILNCKPPRDSVHSAHLWQTSTGTTHPLHD